MKVEIRLFADLRELAGQKSLEEELPDSASVGDAIEKLAERLGNEFRAKLLDGSGRVRGSLNILVNGKIIFALDGTLTRLKDGDVVAIFPPVAGGGFLAKMK